MPADFIPTREAELVTWSTNFDTRITATPVPFGLTAAQATAYDALHDAFVAFRRHSLSPVVMATAGEVSFRVRRRRILVVMEGRVVGRGRTMVRAMNNAVLRLGGKSKGAGHGPARRGEVRGLRLF